MPIQANKGKGLDQLKQAIADAACASRQPPSGTAVSRTPSSAKRRRCASARSATGRASFLVRRLLLDVGGHTEKRLAIGTARRSPSVAERPASGWPRPAARCRRSKRSTRYAWIREATAGCIGRPAERPVTWTDRLDRVLTHKLWGTLIFLAVMFLVFQSIFTWAKPLMDLIDQRPGLAGGTRASGYAGRGRCAACSSTASSRASAACWCFLPQIMILFGFIAILEDCGYMARAAFLMDRLMSRCGLSGKSFIPLLSSVACAVPGIMAARVIENRRDRLATILVAPLMSCSARLPVYILLIGAFPQRRPGLSPGGCRAW